MSDSESVSDLAVEQYDPEDNLNAYGSPVVRSVDEEILAVAPARQNIESNRTQVSVLVLCLKIITFYSILFIVFF
jgi:hypothetical protein